MSTPPFALKLEGVSKSFGGLRAVDGVELAVRPGERRALIGPNGAGKTTLFNLIAGALPVSSGRITLFGDDVTGVAQHRRAALGLARTYQITNLFPTLTVVQNVLLAAQAHTPARFAMLRPVSGFAHLEARAREPVAGLSQAEAQLMTALLHRLDPSITLLIIEHDMDIALEVARHVTVLHYGRVIADGPRETVRNDPTVREIYLGA